MDRALNSIAVVGLALVVGVVSFHFGGNLSPSRTHDSRLLAAENTYRYDANAQRALQQFQAEDIATAKKPQAKTPARPRPASAAPVAVVQPAAPVSHKVTPAVKPPPPPPAPVPVSTNSIDNMIKSVFAPLGPGAVAWALRVADCESGDNPSAVNYAGGDYGLFQFTRSTFAATPYGRGNIFDALTNARAAEWLYSRSGGGPWGCS